MNRPYCRNTSQICCEFWLCTLESGIVVKPVSKKDKEANIAFVWTCLRAQPVNRLPALSMEQSQN